MSSVQKIYEDYLEKLKKLPKTDKLPGGETVEFEIDRVTEHLASLKNTQKYYRVVWRWNDSIIGYCKESAIDEMKKFLKKKKFWLHEIPKDQYESETKEIPFVF